MDKNKPVSFRDNIYRMLLKYAVIPAFVIAFAGGSLLFGLWAYSTGGMVKKANQEIQKELALMVGGYEEALVTIAEQSELVRKPIGSAERVAVFEDVYGLSNQLGYRARLYVFNKDYEPVIASTAELPAELKGDSVSNWGIFRQMNEDTSRVVFKVVQGVEERSSRLFLGKAMLQNGEIAGYAIFSIDGTELNMLLTRYPTQTIVTDSFGWIFQANHYDFCDNLNRMNRDYEEKSGYLTVNGKHFYLTGSAVLDGELRVYSVYDMSSQFAAFRWGLLFMALLFAAILICLIQGANRIAAESTKDIEVIEKAFSQVQEGNLDSYIRICSSMEFHKIGESYNLMLDSLKEQIEKNREMIAHMAFAQIKQLESQINPHFLFNTLENIRVMCKLEPAKADRMIVNLSSLLRYSISNAEEDVTVRRDMENTQHYLSILKIRYNQKFHYEIEIDEDVEELIIPKILIQPLIENAIKYGFGDKEVLRVKIRGYRQQDKLIFICEDDGAGIEEETLAELRHTLAQPKNRSSHLGLYNIHKRIQLKYKGDYGVAIESVLGKGTKLTLTLPVIEQNAENSKKGES